MPRHGDDAHAIAQIPLRSLFCILSTPINLRHVAAIDLTHCVHRLDSRRLPFLSVPVFGGSSSMRSFKMLAESAGSGDDRWYVSDGATAVGPVGLDLITRGIREGKVPMESYVRHEAWRVWRPVCEVAEMTGPKALDSAAPTPPYYPLHRPRGPAVANHEAYELAPSVDSFAPTDDITLPGRPLLPEEIAPADALEGAADLSDALHLLLNAAVMHLRADAALLHRIHDSHAVVHFAHGPFSRVMIGIETELSDAAMVAARTGDIVVAEPSPGPAGMAVCTRLLHLGVQCEGALMQPILISGHLVAILDLGRQVSRFRVAELVVLEKLVETFVAHTEAGHWH